MMTIAGQSLGFVVIEFLLLLPLAILFLLYIYRKKEKSRKTLVSSTLILRNFKQQHFSPKKFAPPPRFFFEALLFTLLCLAAARLFHSSSNTKEAILIDNSFSMFALGAEAAPGETFFKKAIAEAERILRLKPSSRDIEVFVSSPGLSSLTNGAVDAEAAAASLDTARVSFSKDSLLPSIQKLLLSPEYSSVRVLSDKPIEHSNKRLHIEKIRPESPLQNIAFSSIGLRKIDATRAQKALELGVISFANAGTDLRLTVLPYRIVEDTLEPAPALERSIKLDALSSKAVVFDGLPEDAAAFRASLSIPNPKNQKQLDAIREDNTAWLTQDRKGQSYGIVSAETPRALGLTEIPFVDAVHIIPAQYQQAMENLKAGSVLVFYKQVPRELPGRNALFVLPPQENPLFQVRGTAVHPEISKWETSHSLLSYVNMPLLSFREAIPLSPLSWTASVIGSTAGPLLLAGETRGQRYVAAGFEIFPYEGKKSPGLSILLLNILKWLSDAKLESGFQRTGSLLEADKVIIESSYFATLPGISAPTSIEPVQGPLALPGIVKASFENGGFSFIAVNFFDEDESNLLNTQPLSLSFDEAPSAKDAHSVSPLRRHLLFAVLMFLLLDMVLQLRHKVVGAKKQ